MAASDSEKWRLIEQVFHAALAVEPGQRPAFVLEACRGDEELRREVESLLSAEESPALLDRSLWVRGETDLLSAGSQFGCFRIEGFLGEGGMGGVYRARDVKLGRDVAFKVLARAVAHDPDYLRRFEQEARLASSLNHPNIVTIYYVGEERGVAFMAMELVRGRTLAELLADGALALPKALDLAVQLAGALAAAHASGITHRDLKPANIMITEEDRVKVLDFGLAKRHQVPTAGLSTEPVKTCDPLTGAGVILGTVGYMSPEQAAGGEAGHTADQFSFGAILYEMLSGCRAFKRVTAVETLAAIIREEPAPLHSLNPAVPSPLRQIVDRCLAKNPADRYPVTEDLATQLRQLRDRWETSSGPTGVAFPIPAPTGPRAQLFTRRRAVWSGAIAAVSAATAFTAWKFSHSGIRLLAVLPFENATKDPDADFLCDGLTDSLIRQIANLPLLGVRPRNAVFGFRGRVVDPQTAGQQLHVDAVVTGSVSRRAGRLSVRADLVDVRSGAVLWSARYDREEADLFRIQDEIASAIVDEGIRLKLSGEDRRLLTRHSTNDREANELYMRARARQDRETEDDYLTARQFLLQAVARDRKFALAYSLLAENYGIMAADGYARPAESWPLTLVYAQQALDLDPTLLGPHGEVGSEAFFNQRNWALAEREYKAGSTSEEVPINMGYPLERWALGHPEDALRLIRNYRAVDPLSAGWRLKEADMLFQMGQYESAAGLYDAIIHDEPSDARAFFGLAEVRSAQKRFAEAIVQLRQGYQVLGEDDATLLELLSKAQSESDYRKVQERQAQLELDSLAARAAAHHYVSPLDFARANSQLGRKEEAFKYLDAAFEDRAPGLVFLKVDRAWDRIRDDPRFSTAITKVGLP